MDATRARILLFTGHGKGKSTAALGMALRAAGHRMPVYILQFIKRDAATGELAALHGIEGITVRQCGRGFVPAVNTPAYANHCAAALTGLGLAAEAISGGAYTMIVLDEICTAVALGLLAETDVVALLRRAPPGTIVVLTGRGATPELIAQADTVTEMRCVKHGADSGWPAQPGVER